MKLTAEQKRELEDLREHWIEAVREGQHVLESLIGNLQQFDRDRLRHLGLDDEYDQLLEAHRKLYVEYEESLYEALEEYVDPEAEPVLIPHVRPHFNPDPDSLEPAERAGLRVAESRSVRNDNVNHDGYWGRKTKRHPDEIEWVGIHVTGVGNEVRGFATRSAHRKMHDGDMFLARSERYSPLEYSTIFSWSDRGHWVNLPFWAYAYASTALNRKCISWVYDGQWPKDRAVAQEIVDAAVASLMQTLEDLWDWKTEWNADEELRAGHKKSKRHKCDPLKTITLLAHRQGDGNRGADPGPQLWTRVVLEVVRLWNEMWGNARFKVRIDPKATYGKGDPIPESWLNWQAA